MSWGEKVIKRERRFAPQGNMIERTQASTNKAAGFLVRLPNIRGQLIYPTDTQPWLGQSQSCMKQKKQQKKNFSNDISGPLLAFSTRKQGCCLYVFCGCVCVCVCQTGQIPLKRLQEYKCLHFERQTDTKWHLPWQLKTAIKLVQLKTKAWSGARISENCPELDSPPNIYFFKIGQFVKK